MLDCVARAPERLRTTCLFYPADPAAPSKLAALVAQHPEVVALRFHAHRGKEMYLHSFADTGVRMLWRQAAELNLIIELHIGPNYAAQAADLIRAYDDTSVLIDHMGEPSTGSDAEFADILALARLDNVYMKLSGLEYLSHKPSPHHDIVPFTQRLAATFGPERLVWGGGTPTLVDVHLAEYSPAERALVKGGNLLRLLRFGSQE